MNAPTPALVASRPERLRLVGQRRQILAMMHQRLMFGMLVYAGVIALIALRILYLAAFGDHAGRKGGVDRPRPRTRRHRRPRRPAARADDRCLDHRPPAEEGHRRQARARPQAGAADAGDSDEATYFAMLRVGQDLLLSAPPRRAGAGRGGQCARRAGPGARARARPALSADQPRRACHRLHRRRRPRRRGDRARASTSSCRDPAQPRPADTLSISSRIQQALEHELLRRDDQFLGDRRGRA